MIKEWHPEKVVKAALDAEEKRMGQACALVQRQVKTLLNTKGSAVNRSAPGEPPRKQTGRLYDSIFFRVERTPDGIIGVVYSTDVKARRLEFGFVGKDRLGRVYDQQPRPFMRPGLRAAHDRVKKVLGAE